MKILKIYKIYFFALVMYLPPPVLFGLFIVEPTMLNKQEVFYWAWFLITLFPCGLIGIALTSIGLVKSFKNKNQFNKDIGIIGVSVGGMYLFGGILALMLLYIVLH